jgi:transcriptional regulator with XRE-family HTH domain
MGFWDRVTVLRVVGGVSGRELSAMIATSTSYLSAGQSKGAVPSAERALAIAKVFGTSVEYLVAGEGDPPTDERVREAVALARAKAAASAA